MRNTGILVSLFLFSVAIIGCVDSPTQEEIPDHVTILVSDVADECHIQALNASLDFYEDLWGQENQSPFEIVFAEEESPEWEQERLKTIRVTFFSDLRGGLTDDGQKTAIGGVTKPISRKPGRWIINMEIYQDLCLETVYIHEMGHAFSLPHEEGDSENYMSPEISANDSDEYYLTPEQVASSRNFALGE